MVFDLYFIAKRSPSNPNLSYWHEDSKQEIIEDTISFNLDKFKFKNNNDHLFQELAKELTYQLKETDFVKKLFSEFNGNKLNIELIDDFHHLMLFDDNTLTLKLDSKIESKLAPVYLFAIYFGFAREKYSANQIYKQLFDFLLAFDFRALKAVYDFFEFDSRKAMVFDPGNSFLSYILAIYKIKTGELSSYLFSDNDKYRKTQLLRNRSLAGMPPYDIKRFEKILDDSDPDKDLFSGEINQELFDLIKESFDENYASLYYQNLTESLKYLGLKIVAQRGSRVAHEQGPILVNSPELKLEEGFIVKVKKIKSHVEENLNKLRDNLEKLELDYDLQAQTIDVVVNLDSLVYLTELESVQAARFKKDLLVFHKALSSTYFSLKKYIRESLTLSQFENSTKLEELIELINSQEKYLEEEFVNIVGALNSVKSSSKNAVIYVQRLSSRSGHFIPRLLLGQKLYVETDEQSEKNRLDAIPFNFVVPDLSLIANRLDSFLKMPQSQY
jgi:hypothetical protein